jgi:hypothetical protein
MNKEPLACGSLFFCMRKPSVCWLASALLAACHADPTSTQQTMPTVAPPAAAVLQGTWQLDYYPDSLLANRDIYNNSNWSAPYAANLRFAGDSCEFSGWHERWTVKMRQISPQRYTAGDSLQSWEFKSIGPNKVVFREVRLEAGGTSPWYPYHRVARVLTPASLNAQVVKRLFAGRYRVLQSSRPADSILVLGADSRVRGLPGVARYRVITEMDWDFALPNGFSWETIKNKEVAQYSFRFSGDTLVLHHYEVHPEEEAVPTGILVTKPAMKLLKISPR